MKKWLYILLCLLASELLGENISAASRSRGEQIPRVSAQIREGFVFLVVDGVEFKISEAKSFSHLILRYHIPTATVYLFYSFRNRIAKGVLVTQRMARSQAGGNISRGEGGGTFVLEPPFFFQKTVIGKDRLPIFGSIHKKRVVFAPLTEKLLRLLSGDSSEDDTFTTANPDNLSQYVRAQDFVELSKIPVVTEEVPEMDAALSPCDEGCDDFSSYPDSSNVKSIPSAALPDDLLQDMPPVDDPMTTTTQTIYQDNNTSVEMNERNQITVRYGLKKIIVLPENF